VEFVLQLFLWICLAAVISFMMAAVFELMLTWAAVLYVRWKLERRCRRNRELEGPEKERTEEKNGDFGH
jgi:hypothetical protein